MYISFDIIKKVERMRSEWIFLDHTFYVLVDKMVMNIFAYVLIMSSSSYKNKILNS